MPPMRHSKRFGMEEIQHRLCRKKGPQYWRGLQELADDAEFRKRLESEYPEMGAGTRDLDRRQILKLIGASLAVAGLTACSSPPPEKIVPYVHDPEGLIPGRPLFYATAMPLSGYGKGVLVESHMGRPTKVEGNPRHPASLGATDIFAQASIFSLYDPDRSQAVMIRGRISSWAAFSSALAGQLEAQALKKGAGLRILSETVTSPTFIAQIQEIQKKFPMAQWHQYEPENTDGARAGSQLAFGQHVNTYYQLSKAEVILSLDSDFLTHGPAWLRYSREWAEKRRHNSGTNRMSRLYTVESTPTCTGAVSDSKVSLRATEIEGFAWNIAGAIGLHPAAQGYGRPEPDPEFAQALAGDLQTHRGSSAVISGETQPDSLHALAHAMNEFLGNAGSTVVYTDPADRPSRTLRELTQDMKAGKVELLLIIGGDPVFTAPADENFADGLARIPFTVHLGTHFDETSALCQWHIPESHYLESWSDVRAFDGTASIIQPLIAPLYDSHTAHEILAAVQGNGDESSLDAVRGYWQTATGLSGQDFANLWQASLESGVIANTAFAARDIQVMSGVIPRIYSDSAGIRKPQPGSMEIIFRPDPSIFDGRFANNGWLQELPKPITKITWENAALLGPETARKLGFDPSGSFKERAGGQEAPVIELRYRKRLVKAPVYVLAGHPENSVTVHFGYGRSRGGKIASGRGFNAYLLRSSNAPAFDTGLEIRRTEETATLAATQFHFTMAGRDLIRTTTQDEYRNRPGILEGKDAPHPNETLYHAYDWPYREYKWAMTVNLSNCIGCNACVVACAVENNTPVLGKEQVGRQREMHWLRIDRYFTGNTENPKTFFQPLFCMHCELAPCELVCPVQATNHSSEGINQMVYNRCVGTRFCSHNCPYKVRRFNFLQYSDYITPSKEPMYNPDVTVRSRGVMEKCTYCIQRIQEAKITASKEGRKVKDGEIMTACQQACPTRVFTFGDLNDRSSAVARMAADPLNYSLLAELNTRPRTTYLAAVRNPHPQAKKERGNE